MADNDSNPPGWPFNEQPPPIPPAQPPTAPPPSYEPPAPSYEPPAPSFQPPPPAPAPPPPAAPYQPPAPSYPPPGQPAAGAPPAYSSPGQPPPPTHYYPAAQPTKKSRKSLWITLASIFGVLVLGIGACTVWFISTVKAPVDESNRFLAQIDDGNYSQALAMMTTACDGSNITAEQLDQIFGGAPIDYNLNNSSITNNDATVSGSFSSPALNASRIEVFLRDRDGWKVCGFRTN